MINEKRKKWNLDHKEEIRKYKKRWKLEHKEKVKEYSKNRYKRKKDHYKKWHLNKSYGIDAEKFNIMLKSQKNRCGICKKEFTNIYPFRPCVDHEHTGGKIRGLLCGNCNIAIGLLKDDLTILHNALKWVM